MASLIQRGNRFYVKYKDVDGKWKRKATGTDDERQARKIKREIEKTLARATAGDDDGPLSVSAYSKQWLDARDGRVAGIRDERTRFRLHVNPSIGSMRIDDVKPRHVRDLLLGLRGKLAPRTLENVKATLHTMFRDAEIEELIVSNPVKVPKGILPGKVDKDPAWRAKAVFTRGEVETLISDERIPIDRRVYYALLAFTGMRIGEVAALRWSAYDRAPEPLGMISVHASYSVRKKAEKGTKTGIPRRVPVHPVLAKILAEWRIFHPAVDDELIVPNRDGNYRNQHRALDRFYEDLDRLELRRRRLHDLRRTMITLSRADGARPDLLKWITHGPSKSILDEYTSFPWAPICETIGLLKIERREGTLIAMPAAAVATGPNATPQNPLTTLETVVQSWSSDRQTSAIKSEDWCERQGLNL